MCVFTEMVTYCTKVLFIAEDACEILLWVVILRVCFILGQSLLNSTVRLFDLYIQILPHMV